ncbi:hypothetical protein MBLNU457_6662t1 [Dothideomycetes sp. NU457]
MNWVGGSLHRHSRGARSATLQRQKAHFARVRNGQSRDATSLQPSQIPFEPGVANTSRQHSAVIPVALRIRLDPTTPSSHLLSAGSRSDQSNLSVHRRQQQQQQCRHDHQPHHQQRRQEQERVQSVADATSSEISSDSEPARSLPHAGNETNNNLDLEAEKARLLSKSDWLGLQPITLPETRFSPSSRIGRVAKRRRLRSSEKRSRPMRTVAATPFQDERFPPDAIDVRIGSEALLSTVYDPHRKRRRLSPWMSGALGPRITDEDGNVVSHDVDIQEMAADPASENLATGQAAVGQEEIFYSGSKSHRASDSILFQSEQTMPDRSESDLQVSGNEDEGHETGSQENETARRSEADDIRTTDRAWLSFLGLEQCAADVVPNPSHHTPADSYEAEISEHLSSDELPDHGQAATPRGVPSEFSNTLLSLPGIAWPKNGPNTSEERHQFENSDHVSAVESPRPRDASRGQNATMMNDPNDVWRRFVFGSEEPDSETERTAGATSYAVTLHDGDKTPSPNSIAGQCSTQS